MEHTQDLIDNCKDNLFKKFEQIKEFIERTDIEKMSASDIIETVNEIIDEQELEQELEAIKQVENAEITLLRKSDEQAYREAKGVK